VIHVEQREADAVVIAQREVVVVGDVQTRIDVLAIPVEEEEADPVLMRPRQLGTHRFARIVAPAVQGLASRVWAVDEAVEVEVRKRTGPPVEVDRSDSRGWFARRGTTGLDRKQHEEREDAEPSHPADATPASLRKDQGPERGVRPPQGLKSGATRTL